MIAGVLKETFVGERRVAVVPAVLPALAKAGIEVLVESGAGTAAGFPDPTYVEKGGRIAPSAGDVYSQAELILSVRSLAASARPDLSPLQARHVVVAFLEPLAAPDGVAAIAGRGATAFALELLPRITRAQAMDVLSSMAMVVGYKAVLLAAAELPRLLPMMTTAGGTLTPGKVFVIGGGVAGLQAIATARRLGAVVEAYDIRPAVKEQVESLGAKFVELPLEARDSQDAGGYAKAMDEAFYRKQRELMAKVVAASDIVITTAAVPGKKAPVLVTGDMVDGMRPGSVVIDVAAEQGGNCEVTRPGERVERNGVTVLGPLNLASQVAGHASFLWAKNLTNFLSLVAKEGKLSLDFADPILAESVVARGGDVVHARVREALGMPALPSVAVAG